MKIYYDATESREGTRLPENVITSGKKLVGLERLTGADLLITTVNKPELPGNMTNSVPCMMMLRKACEDGLLIQRKSGGDLVNSIDHLDQIEGRMLEWTVNPWLLVTGDFKCNRDGNVVVDGRETKFSYWGMIGALDFWQIRGGGISLVCNDNHVGKWIADMANRMEMVGSQKEKLLEPRKPRQLLVQQSDDEQAQKIIAAMTTLMTFPGIGPTTARKIAEGFGSLAWALYWLSHPKSPEGKIKIDGVGKETFRKARHWLGLDEFKDESNPMYLAPCSALDSETNVCQGCKTGTNKFVSESESKR